MRPNIVSHYLQIPSYQFKQSSFCVSNLHFTRNDQQEQRDGHARVGSTMSRIKGFILAAILEKDDLQQSRMIYVTSTQKSSFKYCRIKDLSVNFPQKCAETPLGE